MRAGIRVGVDVGKARVGVARSDLHGMLATPVQTVARSASSAAEVLAIAREHDAVELVVGLPLSLSGGSTPSTDDARAFARELSVSGVPVRLVDERLSTVSAQQALRANGRTTKNSRAVIDQVAAVIILQHALDAERSSGTPPGTLVVPDEGPE
ncbi:putative Holliday junction resolvase [Homoserinimonas aerilata]|uniref:Putative pre-16S rRNA nuclease n=1 Tax=Homoserinimonas aerilata TaxID=1162970 RepID=A0A542YIP4_9MICO|nr:Holliday junction resolvase RuvX [Homoserinimonas aerilata]TQL47960.1 putative Holliday junction resolvase [Homoserinimonas aerilata]